MSIANTQSQRVLATWVSPRPGTQWRGQTEADREMASVISQGTYEACLGSCRTDKSVSNPVKNLKVYVEALMGISALHRPDGLNNTYSLEAASLQMAPTRCIFVSKQ